MATVNIQELLDSGVHFGHLTRKWNPNMAPYIYTERNGVHIIDLYKTAAKIEETSDALKKIANSGRKILFVVDIKKEHIAVAEAQKLNIPIFAMVDTNSDPRLVDYVIPANDDASKSIDKVLSFVTDAIAEGLSDRKSEKEKVAKKEEAKAQEAPKKEKVAKEVETPEEVETKAETPKKVKKVAKKKETKAKASKKEETKVEAPEASSEETK